MRLKIVYFFPKAEVTSPLTTHIDLNAFKKIYDKINGDPHGPEVALRLLAHKIQSPQAKEALSALVVSPNFLYLFSS